MSFKTTVTILTLEPVTPEYLAQRVTEACAAQGALRPGEGVYAESGTGWNVLPEALPVDVGPFTMYQRAEEREL